MSVPIVRTRARSSAITSLHLLNCSHLLCSRITGFKHDYSGIIFLVVSVLLPIIRSFELKRTKIVYTLLHTSQPTHTSKKVRVSVCSRFASVIMFCAQAINYIGDMFQQKKERKKRE